MKRKILPIILSLALVLGSVGIAFADEAVTTSAEAAFTDLPDNWSTEALNKAVENQLLMGYEEEGAKLIKPDNSLTRAEMAAVVNRAFASSKEADISKVTDVASWAWYVKDMAKAVKMGTFALDTKMRPGDKITRQEAFAVLSRAFKLAGDDEKYKALDKFSDKEDIVKWALNDLNGLAEAGYIQGSGGKLNPTANITRAEFAVVMDNLVKEYIDEADTVTEVVDKGNVMVRVPGVILKDVSVKGDLIIADGVGEGDVTLDNVKVEGRTVVRGGGENSIIIKGNSDLGKIIVSKADGKVRISVEGNADVEIVIVDDGSDDVLVEGKIGNLEVAGNNVTVTATNATFAKAEVSGDNSKIILGTGSTVKDGTVSGKASAIVVNEGATVDNITVKASDASIEGKGTVKNVDVVSGGNNASVTTPNTVTKVDKDVSGVKAGGVVVPGGSTATNNATGTDAEVKETPSTSGGSSGSTPSRDLIIYVGDKVLGNISPQSSWKLSEFFNIVEKITNSSEYNNSEDRYNNLNFNEFKSKFVGTFSSLGSVAEFNELAGALYSVAYEIEQSADRLGIVAEAKAISAEIAAGPGVVYNGKTVKLVTVEAAGVTCVVYDADQEVGLGNFVDLYNAVKGKTFLELAGAKVTIVTDDGDKVVELKYE
jgi:hypothetical protein